MQSKNPQLSVMLSEDKASRSAKLCRSRSTPTDPIKMCTLGSYYDCARRNAKLTLVKGVGVLRLREALRICARPHSAQDDRVVISMNESNNRRATKLTEWKGRKSRRRPQ